MTLFRAFTLGAAASAVIAVAASADPISNAEYDAMQKANAITVAKLEDANVTQYANGRNLLANGCLEARGAYNFADCFKDKNGYFLPGYTDGTSGGGGSDGSSTN